MCKASWSAFIYMVHGLTLIPVWINDNSYYDYKVNPSISIYRLGCCPCPIVWSSQHQGLYSLSGKTSYRKISWSLEAARFGFKLFQSLWNLAGTSAALLPRCLSNFRAIQTLQHPISRLRDFTRFGGKTSCRLVNRGPGSPPISLGVNGSQATDADINLHTLQPCLFRPSSLSSAGNRKVCDRWDAGRGMLYMSVPSEPPTVKDCRNIINAKLS